MTDPDTEPVEGEETETQPSEAELAQSIRGYLDSASLLDAFEPDSPERQVRAEELAEFEEEILDQCAWLDEPVGSWNPTNEQPPPDNGARTLASLFNIYATLRAAQSEAVWSTTLCHGIDPIVDYAFAHLSRQVAISLRT